MQNIDIEAINAQIRIDSAFLEDLQMDMFYWKVYLD
jgi:hypothetical protein